MSTPFLSEIRIMSFNFAPKGWAMCNGQLMQISQNQALFSLLGTTYGGDGRVTFGLPNLQGRVPMHMGNGHIQGERAGEEYHTVTPAEMPAHTHLLNGTSNPATATSPSGNFFSNAPANLYGQPTNVTTLHPASIANIGGSQPHENRSPYLALNFCIALTGIYPTRN